MFLLYTKFATQPYRNNRQLHIKFLKFSNIRTSVICEHLQCNELHQVLIPFKHHMFNYHLQCTSMHQVLVRIANIDTSKSKIEKVPRGIRGEKSSKDMASSRNLVSTIGALASPKMGDGTRCPEG